MRRALAILKYVPAVLCGLLVVAWVVSCWFEWRFSVPLSATHEMALSCASGTLTLAHIPDYPTFRLSLHSTGDYIGGWLGCAMLIYPTNDDQVQIRMMYCPIPACITLLLPLAVGPFVGFRCSLCFCFAWTALIAAELAYYLR
jgi:hypothetical protein